MGVLRFIQGLMWARRESIGGHSPVGGPQMDTGVISIRVAPTATTGAGAQTGMQSIPDNADAQAAKGELLGVVARLQGLNPDTGTFSRVRLDDDSGALPLRGVASCVSTVGKDFILRGDAGGWVARSQADRNSLATLSSAGAALSATPGEWSVFHAPAAATVATITRAATVLTRHVCRSITVSVGAVAAQGPLEFVLRDGAAGVGPILWQAVLSAPAGSADHITISGLSILGSVNTAMTLECLAAPAATNLARVSLAGYDAL